MKSKLRLSLFDRNAIFVLIIIMILFAAPLILKQIPASADFGMRIQQASDMTQGNTSDLLITTPYYSVLIYILYSILPVLGWIMTTVVIGTSFYIVGVLIVYRTLAGALTSRSRRTVLALIVLTLALMVIQPISLSPLLSTRDMLFEWINLSPHYNPTSIALRVFALPLTLIAVAAFGKRAAFSWKQIFGVMVMVIFSTLIKPNWLLAFVPVYTLVVIFSWLRGITLDRRMILIGFGVSSVIVLTITFGVGFIVADNSSIVVRFFAYEVTPIVVLKLLLSVAFPLYVSIVWREQARQDWALLLSWGVLAAAIAQALLFSETGLRAGHGNFLWGQSIAGWVLFVLSVRLYVRQTSIMWQEIMPTSWTWRIATLLLTLHTATGLLWWIAHYGSKPVLYS